MLETSQRFSDRVSDYVRYRPGYPVNAIGVLERELALAPGRVVADVGAGTGMLTQPLAATGADVIALDPNEQMLAAAREHLAEHDNVRIEVASAEGTGLPDHSVDAITCGQAFHWFDPVRARAEFRRVLVPGGRVALVWNRKHIEASQLLADLEVVLHEHAPEFAIVRHEKIEDAEISTFYGRAPSSWTFSHEQRFDWDGFRGRLLSSSYTPAPGSNGHDAFVAALHVLFDRHQLDGEIVWPYVTHVYVGEIVDRD